MGVVQAGAFLAETPEQFKAIKWAEELGEELAIYHPELADRWRDVETCERMHEIAEDLLPDIYKVNSEVARQAVVYALGKLLPARERKLLTKERLRIYGKQQFAQMSPEELRSRQSRATKRRNEIHGNPYKKALVARGLTEWSAEEKAILVKLAEDARCKRKAGRYKGGVDWKQVADILNASFHGSQNVRTAKTVADYFSLPQEKKEI